MFLALHFGTWVPSVKLTSVASATALVATQSIFTGLFAAVAGRRLPGTAWLGMLLAVVGTAFIAGADFGVSARALTGDGLAVLGGLFAAAYVTVGVDARRTHVHLDLHQHLLQRVRGGPAAGLPARTASRWPATPARAWVLIVAVTCCAQLLGHSLINVVLRSMSATLVSLAVLVETPGAALIAGIWLHQWPAVWALPGLVLLFCGLVLVVARPGSGFPVAAAAGVRGRRLTGLAVAGPAL